MANEDHLALLKQGVEAWNKWREINPEIKPDLSKADLTDLDLIGVNLNKANLYSARLNKSRLNTADLHDANLFHAILNGADLSDANLSEAVLNGAYLSKTNLTRANMPKTDLRGALLSTANLSKANLFQANLYFSNLFGANLTEAVLAEANLYGTRFGWALLRMTDFSRATVGWSEFGNVDLSLAKGLESVKHDGPSSIGIEAFSLSKGKIPESFLRGVGISNVFIKYIHSLSIEAIEYYSCFISYSINNESFAKRLHADLQDAGVRCWFAPEDMKIGDKIRPAIDQSIRVHDKLLLVLSEHSISSEWVEKEVETAFEEEAKRKQIILFPIRIDDAVMLTEEAWAADIRRSRHIGNFTGWEKHDVYIKAFDGLLIDLKASD
jgi:hypothetical protein